MIPRIGILGTTCTGKSTLVEQLVQETKLAYIKEDARDLYKKLEQGPSWNREDPANQLKLQCE